MKSRQYQIGRAFLGRLPYRSDLLESIGTFCTEKGLQAAFVSAIGAVERATVGFYNQREQKYERVSFDEPLELVTLSGNLSTKDGKPFVHAHVVLSRGTGETVAGHLMSPTTVFAGEAFVVELCGEPLARELDEQTGLALWAALK
jgi:hypothetical protein